MIISNKLITGRFLGLYNVLLMSKQKDVQIHKNKKKRRKKRSLVESENRNRELEIFGDQQISKLS